MAIAWWQYWNCNPNQLIVHLLPGRLMRRAFQLLFEDKALVTICQCLMKFFFRTGGSLKAWRLDQFEILHLSLLETQQYFRSLKKLFDLTVGLQVCILIILLAYSALTEKPFPQIKQQSSFGSKSSCLLWVPVMLSNGDIKLLSPR